VADERWSEGSFLGRLSVEAEAALSERWQKEPFEHDQLIVGEGDQGSDLFIILEGRVRAALFTMNGRQVTFAELGPGDCFGEMSAIDKRGRSASVISVVPGSVARIRGAEFDEILLETPEIALALLRLLTGRLRAVETKLVDYVELTAAQRIRREVLQLAEAHRTGLDSACVRKPPNQSDIATRVFARREDVNREFSKLQRSGLISKTESNALLIPSIRKIEESVFRSN
jgi:CRP-like cAMP-binding protein